MSRPLRGAAVALATSAVVVAAVAPAAAAPPTRIADTTAQVTCLASDGATEVVVGVGRSELLEETESRAEVTSGETVLKGRATSEWTPSTFRARVPVRTEGGELAGEVYFSGTYAPSSQTTSTTERFNAGNVHVVERHTYTETALSDIVVSLDGREMDVVRCDGTLTDGYLFFTNPATRVERGSLFAYQDCSATNLSSYGIFTEGGVEELVVDLAYDDLPGAQAFGVVRFDGEDTWVGELRVQVDDEEAGTVPATATRERGRPDHRTGGVDGPDDSIRGMRSHFHVTPYAFTLEAGGLDGPATLQCTLLDISAVLHYPNLG